MRKKRSYRAFPEPETRNYSLSNSDGVEKFIQHFKAGFSAEGSLLEYERCATVILSKEGTIWDGTPTGALEILRRQPVHSPKREAAELLFRLGLCRDAIKDGNCEDAVWNAILMMEFYNNIVLLTLEDEVGLARHLISSARRGTAIAYGSEEIREQRKKERRDFVISLQDQHPDWPVSMLLEVAAKQFKVSTSTIKRACPDIWKRKDKTSS